jgi:DNA invertase Pin-like site-specific DNA recombinase
MRNGRIEMAGKSASKKAKLQRVFGHRRNKPEMFRVGLYARVSTPDQQTIPLQVRAMREYAVTRGWTIALQVKEVGSGAFERELRQKLMEAARRREIDIVLVWRLDRWGRSLPDLVTTLEELNDLGVGFVSLTEALDLTTPTGRAMAGLLSVFAAFEHEILRERVRAGLTHARQNGIRLGRPATAAIKSAEIRKLYRNGVSKAETRQTPANRPHLCSPHSLRNLMKKPRKDPVARTGFTRKPLSMPELQNRPWAGTTIWRTSSASLSRLRASHRRSPRRSRRAKSLKCSEWLRKMPA